MEICLSSIILSPLNGNVKMSRYETGDIYVESGGTAGGWPGHNFIVWF